MFRRIFPPLLGLITAALSSCSSYKTTAECYSGPPAALYGNQAAAPSSAPAVVHRAMQAGNEIQTAPYQYGGGHGRPSQGLDCSGSVSYVLRHSGLLKGAMTSGGFRKYGASGPGKWISIYARGGHVFMTVAGLRLDTSNGGQRDIGPRWSTKPRSLKGFRIRHPEGL